MIEINQYIKKDWLPKNPPPQLPETYPELKLEAKKGTIYYYEKLLQAQQSSGKGTAGARGILQACIAAMLDGQDSAQLPDGTMISVPDHGAWEDFKNVDEATKKLLKKHGEGLLQEVKNMLKDRGTVPAELEDILKRIETITPPKFDWKGFLRRFAGCSYKIFTKKSRRKFNERFPENPGLKIKPKKHIMVAVDTSGSVSDEELVEFFHEIHHMYKTGAEVTVVQCDAAISHIGPYKPKDDIKVHGRGGTSFQPVVDYFNENRRKFTCLIYLTDGEAPAPSRVLGKVLWVLSSRSQKTKHLPGLTIKLN